MQTRAILNRNSTFDNFSGSSPDDYVVSAGAGTTLQLRKTDPREHPNRRVFPKKFKSSDYIFDGFGAFRWNATSATALTVDVEDVPIEPGMHIAVVFTYRANIDLSSLNIFTELKDGIGGAVLAGLTKPTPPPFQVGPFLASSTRDVPGMPAKVRLETPGRITMGPEAQLYWVRYGFQFEVPSNVFAVDVRIAADSNAGDTSFDLGEFRLEELSSRMAAQGR